MNRYLTNLCVVLFLFVAVAAASATPYPAYTCTELVGLNWDGTPNAYGGSLLTNGTVVGETISGGGVGLPNYSLCSWNSGGTMTVYSSGSTPAVQNVWGDDAGQYVINANDVELYSGGTYVPVGNSNMSAPYGMGDGGLVVGSNLANSLSWAYDLNTSTYYPIKSGQSVSWAQGASASGYVVGTNNGAGYVWRESNQSYSTISGAEIANGMSNNSQYIVGETTGGKAALYSLAGSQLATYWSGEATFVNDNGLVVGDTASPDYSGAYSGTAMAYFPNFNGGTSVNLTAAYAPSGVTFDFAGGVNDAGQILVLANDVLTYGAGDDSRMFLLTPVATPEPSTLLLAGTGLLGLIAYAWRKRK